MLKHTKNQLFLLCGWISFILGVIGAILPILPTTPFLLVTAYCFSKGSDRLYGWLISLPVLGKNIRDWNEHGCISLGSKIICAIVLSSVVTYLWLRQDMAPALKIGTGIVWALVLGFVLSRPSQRR